MRRFAKTRALIGATAVFGGLLVGAGTANAEPVTTFRVCLTHDACSDSTPDDEFVSGQIIWYNWAVQINGTLFTWDGRSFTPQAVFDAFHAGNPTRLDSQGRSVTQPDDQRSFSFSEGGGSADRRVDYVRVQLIDYSGPDAAFLGDQFYFTRPAS
ncbi:hypothetical protein ABZU76_33985 [Amycolatopsis sp. NPDC005232]|uniref:hypothetical protein n=1 Tax=Amycolatopsis sp. NPDC005232 TaxID=3157027 RepID=UPI0033BDCF0D